MEKLNEICSLIQQSFGSSSHAEKQSSHTSSVTFPVFFAVMGVFLSICYSQPGFGGFLGTVTLVVPFSVLLCGFFATMYILNFIIRTKPTCHRSQGNVKSWKIRIFFISLFLIGIVTSKGVLIYINAECWYSTKSELEIGEIIFRITNIGFLLSQLLVFIFSIRGKTTFTPGRFSSLSVSTIIFTNMIFWLLVTVSDASDLYALGVNGTTIYTSNKSSVDAVCFYSSTGFALFQKMLPYVLPMHLEFFILASSCFIMLSAESASQYEDISTADDSISLTDMSGSVKILRRNSRSKPSLPLILWILGIGNLICNVFAFFGTFLLHGRYFNPYKLAFVQNGLELLLGIIPVFACMYMIAGFYIILSTEEKGLHKTTVCHRDNILIFGMTSTVTYATIDIFVTLSLASHKPYYNIVILLYKNIAFIVEAFLQTLFIHRVHSFLPNVGAAYREDIFRNILLNVSLFSLNIWLIDAYSLNSKNEIILHSYIWNLVKRVAYPFAKYFRFQSSFELFTMYQKMKNSEFSVNTKIQ